ncbi:LPD7 domain-containing protein [Massilia sp. Root1485]|uniref:LPD7 domain-containing protein n=1 Tax=Massilia sp. Root1485 TaxID=1736472 RepID=UPI000701DAE9|nr:LPD7 domain-containing protein [Massilia sp. Root1485]KQZ34951.1 hypothetical protein ASD92_07590 [Massilia sp. Root1485]
MSEQQKDSDVVGSASTSVNPAVTDEVSGVASASVGTESDKPKRRSASRTKAAQDAGDEVEKPKKTRTSRRVAKVKDGQSESGPDGREHGEASQAKVSSPALKDVDLPPLPPAPVPTPEGIAFMQQHVAYQDALQKRSALRLERLERPARTPEENALPDEREPGALVRRAHSKRGKAEKENSIEAGPGIRKDPFSEADLQALHDAEDARLLRQLLERSRAFHGPGGSSSSIEQVSTAAQADIGALHSIKDAVARKLGLAVVAQNRRAGAAYKAEFDKQAPEFRQAVEEVSIDQPDATRSAAASKSKQDVTATPVPNAVPESVRKRFLNVDNDYYFPDRSPAFVDRGTKLATRGEHPEVVRAVVEIAKERGWNSVTVKGSETFRRAAWMEAARNGMQVAGYKPTELDLAQVQQREPNNSIEAGPVRQQGTVPPTSLAKPLEQSADPKLNEKLSAFANDRPTLVVKKYPELVQAYALLDAARKFAETHMPGHEDQFVAIGKALITQQLREGGEVVGPKVYPEQVNQSRSGQQARVKGAQDEALARER